MAGKYYIGDFYPGQGRLDTILASLPELQEQQVLDSTENAAPAPASNLSQTNVFMALLVLVGILVLAHMG